MILLLMKIALSNNTAMEAKLETQASLKGNILPEISQVLDMKSIILTAMKTFKIAPVSTPFKTT